MPKPLRYVLGFIFILILLAFVPLSVSSACRTWAYDLFQAPLGFSRAAGEFFSDFWFFHQNGAEMRRLRRIVAAVRRDQISERELLSENERLRRLLELRSSSGKDARATVFARVIGRSPTAWNRQMLIDKGLRQAIKVNMPVLSESMLVGKISEAGPDVSQVLLITDPNCKIGVRIQRTREQGVLYGALSKGCRLKYLDVAADVRIGDVVVTAGFGRYFVKGILVGKIKAVWKEPGQIYQVALVEPLADLSRVEEVACLQA